MITDYQDCLLFFGTKKLPNLLGIGVTHGNPCFPGNRFQPTNVQFLDLLNIADGGALVPPDVRDVCWFMFPPSNYSYFIKNYCICDDWLMLAINPLLVTVFFWFMLVTVSYSGCFVRVVTLW